MRRVIFKKNLMVSLFLYIVDDDDNTGIFHVLSLTGGAFGYALIIMIPPFQCIFLSYPHFFSWVQTSFKKWDKGFLNFLVMKTNFSHWSLFFSKMQYCGKSLPKQKTKLIINPHNFCYTQRCSIKWFALPPSFTKSNIMKVSINRWNQ